MKQSLLYLLLAALLVGACGRQSQHAPDRKVKVGVVCVGAMQDTSAVSAYDYVGTVEEQSASSLSFPSGGRVTAVYVKEGQHVAAGQLLAEVDNATQRNAYQAAQATLAQAQDGYDRARLVYEKGSLPEVKWIEVQTQLNQAQSMAEIAKKNLDDCRLVAPCSGTVVDRALEVGTTVSPFVPVMRLLNLSGLYVRVSVPENDIAQVRPGMRAQVRVSALQDKHFTGVVEERNLSADPLSHSYMVRIRLAGGGRDLLPGMVCKVSMGSTIQSEGYLIPHRAVQLADDGRRFVWVVIDSLAQPRTVSIGDLMPEGVKVTAGLCEGDVVITDGTQKVSAGTRVFYE